MRVQSIRATAVALMVVWLSAAAGTPSAAQETDRSPALAPVLSLPDGADEAAFAQRLPLPAPPPATVTLASPSDVTGSLAPAGAADHALESRSVPPALSFEDMGAAPEAMPDKAEAAPPPAAAPEPVPPAAPVVAAPPAPAVAAGLDAASLNVALAAFVTGLPSGETAAQTAERRTQRAAIAAVYAARADAPLWIADGHLTAAARAVMARIDHAAEDGLDLARYAVPVPRDDTPAALAMAELAVSEAAVAYARQATGSRIDVARIGGIIDLRPDVADAARVIATLAAAPDAGEALRGFNPPQPGYAALRDKLAELRRRSGEAQSRIPPGPVLKPGMSDARVPLIRARFGLDVAVDDPTVPRLVYDTKVAAAVAAFQRTHGLRASGLLTAPTIAALSGGDPVRLEGDIVANMELWRWLPRDLGPDRVEVNIPDYTARVVRDGQVERQTRVVVGQPDKPTPVFAEQMKFIIVNPYWNVPLSIIKTEMMPKLASDPNYFADHGYEVVERDGTTYVRQPPGEGNALGRIKFMFPNKHSVYLHDTNARSYFSRDKRALSHGCVRVEEPFSFAEAVMGREGGWSEARIRKLIGGQERTINLPKPLPVFITYFTAFVDPQTGFQLRDDVYGYAAKVKLALGIAG